MEEKTEIINTGEDTPAKVIHEDIVQHEDTSPGKKRRSKDIIAAYLTSAGVERGEEKHDIVEPVEKHDIVDDVKKNIQNQVDTSCESVIAVTNISDDKESVVAMLDAEISAADEELNSVLKNLKRKRSGSGDSKVNLRLFVINNSREHPSSMAGRSRARPCPGGPGTALC